MRSVIISAIMAVVIIVGSIFYMDLIDDVSDNLSSMSEELEYLIDREEFADASEKLGEMKDYFNKKKTILAATGNHEEFDEIEMAIDELESYVRDFRKPDAGSKCAALKFMFRHLPRNFKLQPENIL